MEMQEKNNWKRGENPADLKLGFLPIKCSLRTGDTITILFFFKISQKPCFCKAHKKQALWQAHFFLKLKSKGFDQYSARNCSVFVTLHHLDSRKGTHKEPL